MRRRRALLGAILLCFALVLAPPAARAAAGAPRSSAWPNSAWPNSTWPNSTWPSSTWPSSTWPSSPEDGQELSLDRAITLALEHNHRLRAEQAALDATQVEVEVARARRLPSVDAVAGYQRTDNPVAVFGNKLRQGRFGEEDFGLSALNDPEALDHSSAQLLLSQPLWSGGRIAGAVAAALGEHEGARGRHERVRQEVVHQVIEDFSGVLLADLELEAARAALETAGAQVTLTRDVHQAGLVVESDLLLAQVRESEVRELVIRAESGVRRSRGALNLAIGRDLSAPLSLAIDADGLVGSATMIDPAGAADATARAPAQGNDADSSELDFGVLAERARERRPDLAAARQQVAVAESRLALARAERRPELGLQGWYETNDRDLLPTAAENYSLSVGLRIPLFRGGATRAAIKQAEHRLRQAHESAELLEQEIELEVLTLHAETLAAAQRLVQTRRGLELAQRSLEIVQDRYREGLANLPELLAAESALTRARLQEVAARRDQLLSRAALELATGSL